MEKPIIEVRNISKKYDIAHMRGGYIALRDVLANIIKHPLSFMAKRARRAVGLEKKEEFWALKDINFNVKRGEVVGVIGANGAGKSTLLKILSQITPPTEGEVIIRGRVGSLLEVGTGFHPELTGRENIFLNGAILGMKKSEVAAKFDEIVLFAGVEKFLDTPVKYYSSGMYVRLAFSVAAHMEPDILIVDEVLAVGDAKFQKKCLGKMDEITKKAGRTILFVSHNMAAIQQLCPTSVLLDKGRVRKMGPSAEIIAEYLDSSNIERDLEKRPGSAEREIVITKVTAVDNLGVPKQKLVAGQGLSFLIEARTNPSFKDYRIDVGLYCLEGPRITSTTTGKKIKASIGERFSVLIELQKFELARGTYKLNLTLHATTDKNEPVQDYVKDAIIFTVEDSGEVPTWMENTAITQCNVSIK